MTESISYFTCVNSQQITAILHTRIYLLFHLRQFATKCDFNLLIKNIKRCLPRYRILSPISTGVNSPATLALISLIIVLVYFAYTHSSFFNAASKASVNSKFLTIIAISSRSSATALIVSISSPRSSTCFNKRSSFV